MSSWLSLAVFAWILLCMAPCHGEAHGDETLGDRAEFVLAPLPETLPRHFGVIGVRLQGEGNRLRISHVRVSSPADSAGVLAGDLLRGADNYRLTTIQETTDYMQSLPPDSMVILHLNRNGESLQLACGVTDRRRLYGLMIEQDRPRPELGQRHEEWLAKPDEVSKAVAALVADLESEASLDSLVQAFSGDATAYGYDTRLADVEFALHHPSFAARPIAELADQMYHRPLVDRIGAMAERLDLPTPQQPVGAKEDSAFADPVFASWAETPLYGPLFSIVAHAGQLAQSALPDAATPTSLESDIASLLKQFDEDFYLGEGDRDETLRHTSTLRWAKQVDLSRMAAALSELALLADKDALGKIRKAAKSQPRSLYSDLPSSFDGHFHFAQPSSWGWIVVGGSGPNVYGEDAAIIVDLGGDDLYLGGGRNLGLGPASVIIDLKGDDRYVDRRTGGVAGAAGGICAIIDAAGDDVYEGGTLGVAAAFAGASFLFDLQGDDVYLGQIMTQSAAFFGLALLVDSEGTDLYSAAQVAQAFAGPHAVAALVDEGGNDRYVADRSRPSDYGTTGVYKGWAQGVGCGLRGYTAGGLGLLLDSSGHDEYLAGNFSQGVGYFFGLGGLVDTQGDDRYRATRYSQGSAAHQAIGILIDAAGHDTYEGRIAANQGASWDASVAFLIDYGGNDDYQGAGLSQAAAAMNGFSVLFDAGGDDRYRTPSGQADGGSTRYWGGRRAPNMAILIDAAGQDEYDREGRVNGGRLRRSRLGLFRDFE
jgi:hypothetical protein